MQFKAPILFLIFSILFFTSCNSRGEETRSEINIKEEIKEVKKIIREKKTNYKLKTVNKKEINVKLEEGKIIIPKYKNKFVLLNFFATWCKPCRSEIINLVELEKKHKNKFQIVSVLLEKNRTNQEILTFMKKFSINYPVINDKETFDFAKAIGGINSIPTIFMINKNGEIVQKYVGLVPNEMMEHNIKRILEK